MLALRFAEISSTLSLALKIGWIGDAIALIGECAALSTFERTGSHAAAVASVLFLFLHIALFAFNIDVTT
jgi:hypothetical protein